jgi:hypothetical protein
MMETTRQFVTDGHLLLWLDMNMPFYLGGNPLPILTQFAICFEAGRSLGKEETMREILGAGKEDG